jgi:hypothetical protein
MRCRARGNPDDPYLPTLPQSVLVLTAAGIPRQAIARWMFRSTAILDLAHSPTNHPADFLLGLPAGQLFL